MVKKKVTGIGGIFFKSEDPEKIKKWYAKNSQFQIPIQNLVCGNIK